MRLPAAPEMTLFRDSSRAHAGLLGRVTVRAG